MKLYRKYIRPMHCYPGQNYEPKTEPIEEEKWYPEEEREYLENKYDYLNKRSFSDLVFEEKYELYNGLALLQEQEAVKPRVSTVEQRCGNCNKIIEMDGWKACPWCEKKIDWEGWWKKNGTRN